jgi:hypothetical protein
MDYIYLEYGVCTHQNPGHQRIFRETSEIKRGLHSTNSKGAANRRSQYGGGWTRRRGTRTEVKITHKLDRIIPISNPSKLGVVVEVVDDTQIGVRVGWERKGSGTPPYIGLFARLKRTSYSGCLDDPPHRHCLDWVWCCSPVGECIDLYDVKGLAHDHSDLGSHTFASGSLRHLWFALYRGWLWIWFIFGHLVDQVVAVLRLYMASWGSRFTC